jgi:Armadillo/beta-catenin-like repeat
VLVPALRTVGNIVTGDDLQTQVIINCGALGCLLHLLTTSQKKSIKKVCCALHRPTPNRLHHAHMLSWIAQHAVLRY